MTFISFNWKVKVVLEALVDVVKCIFPIKQNLDIFPYGKVVCGNRNRYRLSFPFKMRKIYS